MTELQIGLIVLGAVAIGGVLGYNKWQESRHRKLAEAAVQTDHEDVLLQGALPFERSDGEMRIETLAAVRPTASEARREPGFLPDEANVPELTELAHERSHEWTPEPVLSEADDSALAEADERGVPIPPPEVEWREPVIKTALATPAMAEIRHGELQDETLAASPDEAPLSLLDSRTELIVALTLPGPQVAASLLEQSRESLQKVGKPVIWIAFNERSREWMPMRADQEWPVRHLRVGLQLVNRLGPVSDAELATFAGAMQLMADELMAEAILPTAGVREQAASLDAFCATVDLEIGLNLISKGPAFSGTKIRALAEAAGMVLGADGLFTRYDDEGRAQFYLQNFETAQFAPETIRTLATHGVTFLLDVPRVDHGERVFMQMTELARRFAETLQGVLVDDNRVPLGEPQLEHIRREFVGKPQASMLEFGLPAGSPQALRLFS